jgi:hypothetical protein
MSLLTVVADVCDLISIPRPTAVVSSTDQQVRQLYALANEAGEQLANDYDWQRLRRQHTFTTEAQADQTSAIPADWDHFIANSFFNRSTRRSIIGPITPQQWQAIQAQPQLNRVFLAFIERDDAFLVTPTPTAGETIAYEYISKNWVESASDVGQDRYMADSDVAVVSERLIRLSLRWRFLAAKGLSYAEEMRTYERELEQHKARDGGNTIISATGDDTYILSPNIPEGSFPGP